MNSARRYRREDIIEKGGKQPPNPPPPPMSQARPPLPPRAVVRKRLPDEEVAHLAGDVRWMPPDIVSLGREVQASRKLIADLRALHTPTFYRNGKTYSANVCRHDGHWFPCPDIRLIEEAGL